MGEVTVLGDLHSINERWVLTQWSGRVSTSFVVSEIDSVPTYLASLNSTHAIHNNDLLQKEGKGRG